MLSHFLFWIAEDYLVCLLVLLIQKIWFIWLLLERLRLLLIFCMLMMFCYFAKLLFIICIAFLILLQLILSFLVNLSTQISLTLNWGLMFHLLGINIFWYEMGSPSFCLFRSSSFLRCSYCLSSPSYKGSDAGTARSLEKAVALVTQFLDKHGN